MNENLKSHFYLFFLIFGVLFTFTLPFPLQSLEHPAFLSEGFFSAMEQALCHVVCLKFNFQGHFYSDSPDLIVHVLFLGLFSFVLTFLGLKFSRSALKKIPLQAWLTLSSSYILAFFLIKYGFDKLFKFQFYYPEPNILYTYFGKLDLDILYWSTIGKSYSYNVFLGLMEIIPGILLLNSRTRKLGAFVSFGLMIHVLMINISYGVEVKILSSFLLLLSVLILANYWNAILAFFVQNKPVEADENIPVMKREKLKRLLKFTLVFFIFFESTFMAFSTQTFNGDEERKPTYFGAYQLTNQNSALDSLFGQKYPVKRFFIHSRDYFIIQDTEGNLQDFKLHGTAKSYFIQIGKKVVPLSFNLVENKQKIKLSLYSQNDTLTVLSERLP